MAPRGIFQNGTTSLASAQVTQSYWFGISDSVRGFLPELWEVGEAEQRSYDMRFKIH